MARLNWTRLLGRGTLAAMLALAGGLALGQTPTAAQMDAFKNLTPEQQQAILEQMGGSGQAGSGRRDRALENPETVSPRSTTDDGMDAADERTADERAADERAADGAWRESTTMLPREPRIRASDTVLIEAMLRPVDEAARKPRSEDETKRLQTILERILRGNPYKLDVSGVLRLPGVAPIPMAGLSAKQASERLNLDPALAAFEAKVKLLPLEKMDVDALKPFGYDLFAGVPSTFAPVSDIPLPSEYVVGPGDRFEVQLIGNTKSRQSLVVNRDGRIMFPELGPIAVAGLKFDAAKARIESRVSEQMIGTQAVVSMSDLRSIRIFVLGEAERPGSYTVSGLATITNALFASGGVKTDRFAAQYPAEAGRHPGHAARPLRPAAARRHLERRAAAAWRRDLHSTRRRYGRRGRRDPSPCNLRVARREQGVRSALPRGWLAAGRRSEARHDRAHRREPRACRHQRQPVRIRRHAARDCAVAI